MEEMTQLTRIDGKVLTCTVNVKLTKVEEDLLVCLMGVFDKVMLVEDSSQRCFVLGKMVNFISKGCEEEIENDKRSN